MIHAQQYLPWKGTFKTYNGSPRLTVTEVCISILHGIATISTCLRVEHRRRARRLWWDDYATIIPAVVEVLNVAVLWLRITHNAGEYFNQWTFMPISRDWFLVPLKYKILYSYSSSFCWSTIVWQAFNCLSSLRLGCFLRLTHFIFSGGRRLAQHSPCFVSSQIGQKFVLSRSQCL